VPVTDGVRIGNREVRISDDMLVFQLPFFLVRISIRMLVQGGRGADGSTPDSIACAFHSALSSLGIQVHRYPCVCLPRPPTAMKEQSREARLRCFFLMRHEFTVLSPIQFNLTCLLVTQVRDYQIQAR